MTEEELTDAIKAWRSGNQSKESFYPLMQAISRAFRQGIGLSGTQIDDAINAAFDDSNQQKQSVEDSQLSWEIASLIWRGNTLFSEAQVKESVEKSLPSIVAAIQNHKNKLSP